MYYQKRANSLWQEFQAFALKGNVMELAIAVVIGGAFGKIVSSLADDIILPAAGVLAGGIDVADMAWKVGAAEITYGIFLQAVINFIIITVSIFVFIKILGRLKRNEEAKPDSEKVAEPSEEVKLLREIKEVLSQKN